MIPPDYNKLVYEVYCEFSEKCVSATGLECLLFFCDRGVYQSDDLDLPSWVPDFQRLFTMANIAPLWMERGLPASGSLAEFSDSELEALSDYVLRAPGFTCDTITRIEPEYRLEPTEFLRFCEQHSTPDTKAIYPSGIPLLQALLRTLLMENHYVYGPESKLLDPGSRKTLTVMLITICLIGRPTSPNQTSWRTSTRISESLKYHQVIKPRLSWKNCCPVLQAIVFVPRRSLYSIFFSSRFSRSFNMEARFRNIDRTPSLPYELRISGARATGNPVGRLPLRLA